MNNKIPDHEISYIDEHLTKLERAVKHMREAIDEQNARNFIDNFSAMQWQERSIIAACKQIMEDCKFAEKDIMLKTLDEYKENDS
jgi:hypothetical protein